MGETERAQSQDLTYSGIANGDAAHGDGPSSQPLATIIEEIEMTRTLDSTLQRRRKDVAEDDIADALHGDRTTVSRVFSDQYGIKLSRLEEFLRVMGYRAIPLSSHVREVPESDYQALVSMANIGAQSLQASDRHVRFSRPLVFLPIKPCGAGGS